jgi:hypothetical protein
MKKANVLWIILSRIFLILFNVSFFLIGGIRHNASVWISYGFIHLAYIMLLLTPRFICGGKSSAVFGFSLYSISATYFLIELVTGLIFIFASPEGYIAAFLLQFILAGLYGIVLISFYIANSRTSEAEEERQYQIQFIKEASARLKGLLEKIKDKDAKKKVERVYDAVSSSPVKSHPDLEQIENLILRSINSLEDAVSEENNETIISLSDTLLSAVNERNMRLKKAASYL